MSTNINFNKKLGISGGTNIILPSVSPTPPSFASTKSFQFDGITDRFIGVGNYSELDGQNKATFSIWIKPPSVISSLQIVASVIKNATASNHQFLIRLATNATVQISIDTGSRYIRASSTPLNLNAWNHVMFCFDTTQGLSANRGRVFINGVDATSATSVSGVFSTATGGLYIAENQNGQYDPFEGLLNEFSIWSGSDQRANVSEIWNGGLPNDLNNLPTAPQPTTWQRLGEDVLWNGFAFTMTDVNGGYVNRGIGLNASDPNPTTDVPLFDNKSFTYDGVSDYVDCGTGLGASLGGAYAGDQTLSIWYKRTSSRIESLFQFGNQNFAYGRGLGLLFVNNDLRVSINDDWRAAFTTTFDTDWHHVLYSAKNNGDNTFDLKLYLDGTEVINTTVNIGRNTLSMSPNIITWIGRASTYEFDGNIDEVAFWDSDQSANVSTIFNGGVPNDISALSPLSWWRAEQVTFDGTNWTLIDQGSGANNGLTSSMPLTSRTSDVPT